MNKTIHTNLSLGRWYTLSFAEQFGNIGSEVSRASRQEGKDEKLFDGAVGRALELFDLTLLDKRWKNRTSEIGRAKEVFCDAVLGGSEYGTKLKDLQNISTTSVSWLNLEFRFVNGFLYFVNYTPRATFELEGELWI